MRYFLKICLGLLIAVSTFAAEADRPNECDQAASVPLSPEFRQRFCHKLTSNEQQAKEAGTHPLHGVAVEECDSKGFVRTTPAFIACYENVISRGATISSANSPSNTRADEEKRIADRLREDLKDPIFNEIKTKMAANPLKASLSQLADTSKVTKSQKKALESFMAARERFQTAHLAFLQANYPYVYPAKSKEYKDFVLRLSELYAGEITWGQFNKAYLEIKTASNSEISDLNRQRRETRAQNATAKAEARSAPSVPAQVKVLHRIYDSEAKAEVLLLDSSCAGAATRLGFTYAWMTKFSDGSTPQHASGCWKFGSSIDEALLTSVASEGRDSVKVRLGSSTASGSNGGSFLEGVGKFIEGAGRWAADAQDRMRCYQYTDWETQQACQRGQPIQTTKCSKNPHGIECNTVTR
jgi:hypothetical protein